MLGGNGNPFVPLFFLTILVIICAIAFAGGAAVAAIISLIFG